MFRWIPLLSAISAAGASTSHLRIPFAIHHESGQLLINATSTDSDAVFPMCLIPSAETWFPFSGQRSPFLMVHTIDSMTRVVLGDNTVAPLFSASPAVLGTGPRSDMVNNFESVSIQRLAADSGLMVVGEPDDRDGFLNSCVSDTLLRVRLGTMSDTFRGRLNGDGMVYDFFLSGARGILSLPGIEFDEIFNSLHDHGAIRINETMFVNCTSSVFADLPDISISFSDGGTIVIPPEDYLTRSQNQTCHLKVTRASEADVRHASLFFDPLRIPHMNVRFSSRFMELCDSLA